jgi:hypothetical protein
VQTFAHVHELNIRSPVLLLVIRACFTSIKNILPTSSQSLFNSRQDFSGANFTSLILLKESTRGECYCHPRVSLSGSISASLFMAPLFFKSHTIFCVHRYFKLAGTLRRSVLGHGFCGLFVYNPPKIGRFGVLHSPGQSKVCTLFCALLTLFSLTRKICCRCSTHHSLVLEALNVRASYLFRANSLFLNVYGAVLGWDNFLLI